MKIKTIDILAKEWFDRIYGNSYFSAQITINYGMKDEVIMKVPFQYGYKRQYEQAAKEILLRELYIEHILESRAADGEYYTDSLTRICRNRNIILRSYKVENCLKIDVKRFGGES